MYTLDIDQFSDIPNQAFSHRSCLACTPAKTIYQKPSNIYPCYPCYHCTVKFDQVLDVARFIYNCFGQTYYRPDLCSISIPPGAQPRKSTLATAPVDGPDILRFQSKAISDSQNESPPDRLGLWVAKAIESHTQTKNQPRNNTSSIRAHPSDWSVPPSLPTSELICGWSTPAQPPPSASLR